MVFSTSGGSGGSTTTVTTLDELTAAVEGDDAKIVIVSGTITGDDGDVVKVGSNTSVLGESGASEYDFIILLYIHTSLYHHQSPTFLLLLLDTMCLTWLYSYFVCLALVGVGLRVLKQSNVIIRNLKIQKVLAPTDAIGIQASSQVWVDHVDLSSDMDHGKVSLFLPPPLIHSVCIMQILT